MDERLTHWKKLTNPDYLGAYALQPGEDLIATIKEVTQADVIGNGGKKELKTVVMFVENIKPMVLNRTNSKTITKLFKTPYIEQWKGKKIQIYIEHNIQAFGEVVDGIRVRPFLPKEEKHFCSDCKKEILPFNGRSPQALAVYTQQKYGRVLCPECASKEVENGGK
jgi:DNA-directed RNA polymerase subunit RPC12/RpoP